MVRRSPYRCKVRSCDGYANVRLCLPSLLTLACFTLGITNESGGITFIPLQVSLTGQGGATLQSLSGLTLTGTLTVQSPATKTANKPAGSPLRKGSLSLFFRKVGVPVFCLLPTSSWCCTDTCPPQVYHLASVRLRDLCTKLDISSELRRRIWTCFEFSLVHCTELMMDRHLDQLLMCAVYVMAKVSRVEANKR